MKARARQKGPYRTLVIPCEVCGRAGRPRRIDRDRFVLCDEDDAAIRRSLAGAHHRQV